MQAVYFPYTFLSPHVADTLSACFTQLTVYQPTARHIDESARRWQNAGWLNIRVPAAEFESEIESGLASFRSFGERHGHRKGEAKHFQAMKTPFVEDSSTFILRSEIKRHLKEGDKPAGRTINPKDQLIQACLFLQLAQDFDRQQEEIEHCLKAYQERQNRLFETLKGDEDSLFQDLVSPVFSPDNAQEAFMPVERLSAWTRLFLYDLAFSHETPPFAAPPVILITQSRLVFDELVAQAPAPPIFFDIALNPPDALQHNNTSLLSRLAEAGDICEVGETVSSDATGGQYGILKTAVIPKRTPAEVLATSTGVQQNEWLTNSVSTIQVNTLIGLVS